MIGAQSQEEARLQQATVDELNSTGGGLSIIYDFLLTYLTRTSIRHWSEEALVNGLRVTIYPVSPHFPPPRARKRLIGY